MMTIVQGHDHYDAPIRGGSEDAERGILTAFRTQGWG